MKPADRVTAFVHEALSAGKSRGDIAEALAKAGWTPREIEDGLGAWDDAGFALPVPRPRPSVSAAEAFFYALMFAALGMVAWHVTSLGFDLIDRLLPDPLESAYRSPSLSGMRWSIAALIVFAPLFFLLNNRSIRATRADPGKRQSAVRRGLTFLTMFIASISLLGDLLWVIYSFLQGALTLQVIAKALLLALVAGAIFFYFQAETRDHSDAA